MEASLLLPDLPPAEVNRFVRLGQDQVLGLVLQEFRAWLRER